MLDKIEVKMLETIMRIQDPLEYKIYLLKSENERDHYIIDYEKRQFHFPKEPLIQKYMAIISDRFKKMTDPKDFAREMKTLYSEYKNSTDLTNIFFAILHNYPIGVPDATPEEKTMLWLAFYTMIYESMYNFVVNIAVLTIIKSGTKFWTLNKKNRREVRPDVEDYASLDEISITQITTFLDVHGFKILVDASNSNLRYCFARQSFNVDEEGTIEYHDIMHKKIKAPGPFVMERTFELATNCAAFNIAYERILLMNGVV